MSTIADSSLNGLQDILVQYWGISELRPLQLPAIQSVLQSRDSLVVMPTGGGKSLCYQAPAVLRGGTTVVVSPLISLMKDQVDGLKAQGIKAMQFDSTLNAEQRMECCRELYSGNLNLLFVSPERLAQPDFRHSLQDVDLRAFAIDEAHCISHWGHDFRPEYRQLSLLKEEFPGVSVHAYTATATEQVRADIIEQLRLSNPDVLVGNFDRANLLYRISSKRELTKQIMEVIGRHSGDGGIIYCIKRAEVDEITKKLVKAGISAKPYHAGMSAKDRSATQEAFSEERCDVVVATVAFGMGIDRSNVRYVLHTSMPKSIEHYQQETGRAGRDGLEAECVLLHSGGDFLVWRSLMERASSEGENDSEALENAIKHLQDMDRFCRSAMCRHAMLVKYFGQIYEQSECGACDFCLGETITVEDGNTIAMKIISCVARIKGNFGVGHIISVLRGESNPNIERYNHNELSTYGLLKDLAEPDLKDWVYQLISQGVLAQELVTGFGGMSFPVVKLNKLSMEVLKNERTVKLMQPVRRKKGEKAKASKADLKSWDGVDRDLFDRLRELRTELARERKVPPYVIFSDASLREMAKSRPRDLLSLRRIHGVGDVKLRDYGDLFLQAIHSS